MVFFFRAADNRGPINPMPIIGYNTIQEFLKLHLNFHMLMISGLKSDAMFLFSSDHKQLNLKFNNVLLGRVLVKVQKNYSISLIKRIVMSINV